MTVRARVVTKMAPLSSEFGLSYATKLFGAEALADLPRYIRGPKKGQIKAWLHWMKAESGGWYRRDLRDTGRVLRPGLVEAHISDSPDYAAAPLWTQRELRAPGHLLGDEGRKIAAQIEAQNRESQIRQLTEIATTNEAAVALMEAHGPGVAPAELWNTMLAQYRSAASAARAELATLNAANI